MTQINKIYQLVKNKNEAGMTAAEVGEQLNIDRSTASRYLNELVKSKKVEKIPGKPVKYKQTQSVFSNAIEPRMIGSESSLQPILEEGMAAFLYPSQSLPILLTGETGTGKTYLAETLAQLVKEKADEQSDFPFITFNCADYAQNAELLVGQIFGIKKGAFTGANEDEIGLVEQADGGILFLDEIHRLPASGQEMLFYLMDKGIYHRLGEATRERSTNVALIGATTEDPESALLATLMRRFSVKLAIPPLRQRTTAERESFVEYFLAEEAAKMNADLSIEDDCRDVFLHYDCPGNIGQLKSDIQIACARAYFRFLDHAQDDVLIQMKDLPEKISRNSISLTREEKQVRAIPVSSQPENNNVSPFPNIYQQLDDVNKQKDTKESSKKREVIIRDYIQELTESYQQPILSDGGWQTLIDDDLLFSIQQLKKKSPDFPAPVHANQLFIIALHLQNYRNHLYENAAKGAIPTLIHPNVAFRQTAQQLAGYLQEWIGLELPKEEVELIAHFLTPEQQPIQETEIEQTISILLVTHGRSTASSIAEVANYLLGNDVIQAVDMPLSVSASNIYNSVQQKITNLNSQKGVLLLVDIGSLITMGDTIQHELDIPIKTLSSVNLPMVLEAGRKSLVAEATLDSIYRDAKKGMLTFLEKEQEPAKFKKQRLIATVCFTGEGAAQLLETWIESQLSSFDQDVLIRAVRVNPTTKDISVLKELQYYYNIIAIIGTVPVSIDGVPYIPAWELLQQDGISRMLKLLEITRQTVIPEFDKDISDEEIYPLIVEGLAEIVTYVNPKVIASLLQENMPQIRSFYSWDTSREIGMWMHLGSLVDRMLTAKMEERSDQLLSSIPINHNTIMTEAEKELWQPLFDKMKTTFHVPFSEEMKRELIKLSR